MPCCRRIRIRRQNGHGRSGLSRRGRHRRLGARLNDACRISDCAPIKSGTQTQPAQTQRTQSLRIGQAIGVYLVVLRIRHPHGRPIRPKGPRLIVSRRAQCVKILARIPSPRRPIERVYLVAHIIVLPRVIHRPHRRPIRPDASNVAIPNEAVGVDLFGSVPAFVAHLVSVNPVPRVGHPHGRAIRP